MQTYCEKEKRKKKEMRECGFFLYLVWIEKWRIINKRRKNISVNLLIYNPLLDIREK